jgi:heptosyltransferase-2
MTSGFNKNPLSFRFSHCAPHRYSSGDQFIHEIERNDALISQIAGNQIFKPKIYPPKDKLAQYEEKGNGYITISPASVWFTKQLPVDKWVEFIDRVGESTAIYLLRQDHPGVQARKHHQPGRKIIHPGVGSCHGRRGYELHQ